MRAEIGTSIERAGHWLRKGEVVAIPTETVYGLAANALDVRAVSRIFEVKNRPTFNPLILHTNSLERVEDYVRDFPDQLRKLGDQFWPGPLTLLLPKRDIVPDLVTAGLERVAVRIPRHPTSKALLASLPFPLAAPSANPFGYISPTKAMHVAQQLGDKVPYILDGGAAPVGLESTIVGLEPNGQVKMYRLGGLALETIERVIGPIEKYSGHTHSPQSSGMLKSHYAPRAQLYLGDLTELHRQFAGPHTRYLVFKDIRAEIDSAHQFVMAPNGDVREAAQRLFELLRQLDEDPECQYILAEKVPEKGLGRAVNDRLSRAQAKFK